ncbi:chemotaxis protein CheA [Neptunomonas japonica]|uniref:Chemotaxis protein CheA n=1 Tax=Neptunomonas japonica JAMM 1380 TaxID=1441457 RepID=A0A7R6SWU4_9GAMM|nr:chemotaxis protein CheA [Neptunomonas japonica]BBB31049.1 two-component system, chemotaxis family, sensor kinase CheA [Neptunomonas japonica JAMM 1380]
MSIDLSQFIPVFLEESFEGLEVMESGLLNLEENDAEAINAIFRAAHSIKGGAGTFGFSNITDFTHVVETLMDELRAGRRSCSDSLKSVLLSSVDCIRLLLEAARDGTACDEPQIKQVLQQLEAELSCDNEDKVAIVSNELEIIDLSSSHVPVMETLGWVIDFAPAPHLLMTGNEPILLMSALADLGQLVTNAAIGLVPSLDELNPEELFLHWKINLYSDCSELAVREIFEWVEGDCSLSVFPLQKSADVTSEESVTNDPVAPEMTFEKATEQPANAESVEPASASFETLSPKISSDSPAAPAQNSRKNQADQGSIRVGIDKIDGLINRVGELVITQSMLGQVGLEMSDCDHPGVERLNDGLVQLERNTRDLQEEVMRIRMLPISFVFNRFPRMVHDISSKLGKLVELKLSGEQTELDKTVMEKIGDPLLHLIRNALDHGLETPQERIAAGKTESGTVHLNASHQGGFIIIQIKDDGRGLDTDKIREKALSSGLITTDQLLNDTDIHDLIFVPGFSTVAEVNDLSGRGVGMDVVRRNIEALGGYVAVVSEEGEGSTFTVSLPLTLAILDGQLIQAHHEIYIIPLLSIIESIWVSTGSLNAVVGRGCLFSFRDEYIPVISLSDVFGLSETPKNFTNSLMVIVEGGGKRAGLIVDELQGQQQVVIKSLETNYKRVEGFSGATILGTGQVALILDVAGVIKMGLDSSTSRYPHAATKDNGHLLAKANI